MTARPRLLLIGLAAAWTAGAWTSPAAPLPPPSAVPQGPGAEAGPSNASAPSSRAGSGTERPSLLPAPRLEGAEATGRIAPSAVPLLPSPPPSAETRSAGTDALAPSPSAGHETGRPGLLPARLSGGTETAGEAVRPGSPLLPSAPAGGEAGVAGPVPRDGRPATPAPAGGSRDSGVRSRLVRSLERRPSPRPESAPPPRPSGPASGGGARRRAVFGCPRALLADLLAGAVEPGGVVSALAVEREVLALCRERQAVVAEIVRLEGELRAALDAPKPQNGRTADADGETPPRRVVVRLAAPEPAGERAAPAAKAAAPEPPAYAWFSILGTPGRLRAGVSDGRRVWFVREGDRLPGAVLVQRITARPPGVRVQGAGRGALPYGARPAGDGA